jgi:hypothetical protein
MIDDIDEAINAGIQDIDDFFELLKRVSTLTAPLLLKKVNRIDGGHHSLGRVRSMIQRTNITGKLSSLNPSQVAANRYLQRRATRRSSR